MRYAYPAQLDVEDGAVNISFPDVPGALSFGSNRAEALAHGADALASILADLCDQGLALPVPSPAHGRPMVSVTVLEAAKLALNEAMRARGVKNVELAAMLSIDEKSVRRLRDVLGASKMPEVERALLALGKQLTLDVRDAVTA